MSGKKPSNSKIQNSGNRIPQEGRFSNHHCQRRPNSLGLGHAKVDSMIRRRDIKTWCEIVAREFRPRQIILFGSYAHGTPSEDSDVDVLVVMSLARGRRAVRQAATIRQRVPARFPMDVIVRSPEQIARRLAQGDGFIASVLRYGQMMYEGEHA
jgi:predicted nucleotidyltransferase